MDKVKGQSTLQTVQQATAIVPSIPLPQGGPAQIPGNNSDRILKLIGSPSSTFGHSSGWSFSLLPSAASWWLCGSSSSCSSCFPALAAAHCAVKYNLAFVVVALSVKAQTENALSQSCDRVTPFFFFKSYQFYSYHLNIFQMFFFQQFKSCIAMVVKLLLGWADTKFPTSCRLRLPVCPHKCSLDSFHQP